MSIQLKIKSKHLSEEAKIIRFEERKLLKQLNWLYDHNMTDEANKIKFLLHDIKSHRRIDVRSENRATFLARAFIKGTPYSVVETTSKSNQSSLSSYTFDRLLSMVSKYRDGVHFKLLTKAQQSDLTKELKSWLET